MFDSTERKQQRMQSGPPDTLSLSMYNLLLGCCIFYGLIINVFFIMNFSEFFSAIHPVLFFIATLAVCFLGVVLAKESSNPIVSFLGYSLVVLPFGATLSIVLPFYSLEDIQLAMVLTACVVAVMTILATIYPAFFARLGRTLFCALLGSTISELIALLCGYVPSTYNWIFVIIYTLYIGYDWHIAQAYPKTIDNAIASAMDIYIDIISLFSRILRILGRNRRRN